jgi:hypothetical protein
MKRIIPFTTCSRKKNKNRKARKDAWQCYCEPHETRKQDWYGKGKGGEKGSHVVHGMMGTI